MPDRAKDIFIDNLENRTREEHEYTEEEIKFLETPRNIKDFKTGLIVPGSLKPKRITGGVILENGEYELRPSLWYL